MLSEEFERMRAKAEAEGAAKAWAEYYEQLEEEKKRDREKRDREKAGSKAKIHKGLYPDFLFEKGLVDMGLAKAVRKRPVALGVLLHLYRWQYKGGWCGYWEQNSWRGPTVRHISETTGLSKRGVQQCLRWLEDKGFIQIEPGNRRRRSRYRVKNATELIEAGLLPRDMSTPEVDTCVYPKSRHLGTKGTTPARLDAGRLTQGDPQCDIQTFPF